MVKELKITNHIGLMLKIKLILLEDMSQASSV